MPRRRICFVVSDLLGLVTNSGIGTATSFGAIVLAQAGHDVTLVHTRDSTPLDPSWAARYSSAGVHVEAPPGMIVAPGHASPAYRVYAHLKDRDFDAIVFQDWLALGSCSMIAKRAGLAFGRTQLVHIVHGPDAWLHEANLQTERDVDDVALAHAGQVSAELADTIVGPSRYLIDWMESAGWLLPGRRFVIPYFTEGNARAALGEPAPTAVVATEPARLRELAFFGRLERRKGVTVFVQALNAVDPALLDGVTVSFLGREATFSRHDVLAMIDGRVRRAARAIAFHTDLDNAEACRHLAGPGTLAVIASLVDNSPNTIYECVEQGIPFLATASGGVPELLREEDRHRCLVAADPRAMAEALQALLEDGCVPPPARPAFDGEASLRLWDEVLDWEPPPERPITDRPLVTAVVPHHDRPALVTTAVEALDAQDYPDLEIVVVDDGSTRPDSHEVLRSLEKRSWRHDVRVIRQENRYLGAARNAGAAAGRGELLVFVDDDDVPEPHFVSTLLRAMQASGADAVTCAMQSFRKPFGAPEPADSRGTWVFAGGPVHLAAVQNCLGGAPAMIRRSALAAVGGYHERHGVGYEDWHLYVRLALGGYKIVAVPEALYWYRLQDDSMRNTMSDYHSIQVVLDEYRKAVPPQLRPLVDLSYGQGVRIRERMANLYAEMDLRERVLWLAEERLKRLSELPPVPGRDGDAPLQPAAATFPAVSRDVAAMLRRGLSTGRQRLRRLANAVPQPGRRG